MPITIPHFEDGELMKNENGLIVAVLRTEVNQDGFFVVYYLVNGEEQHCFAVDCEKIVPVEETPEEPPIEQ